MMDGIDSYTGRAMTPADVPAVAALEARLQAFPWTEGNFHDALDSGYDCRVWFDAAGAVRAYAVVLYVLDESHLLTLGVAPEAQRQGMGSAVMRHMMLTACTQGATQMFLEVRVSNLAARGLYEALGFQFLSLRHRYYPAADGAREDAVVMRKELALCE